MLEKLITQIKQSLPEALRKKLGMDTNNLHDDEDDESNNDPRHDKTSVEYRYEGFEDEEIEELEEDEEEEDTKPTKSKIQKGGKKKLDKAVVTEDEAKKRKAMIMRVGLILVIGYFALDTFVLSKKEEAPAESQETAVELVETQKAPEETAPPVTNPEETIVENTENSTDHIETNTAPNVENINISQGGESTITETPEDHSNSMDGATEAIDESLDNTSLASEEIQIEPPVNSQTETKETASTPDFSPDQSQNTYSEFSNNNNSTDYGNDLINSKEEIKIENKIIDTPTDTPAPSYDQFGRGLVYNCIDKHWACIDKPAYVQCHKNQVWNKQQGKKIECAVKAVYNDENDCVKIQMHNVSTNESTAFCN